MNRDYRAGIPTAAHHLVEIPLTSVILERGHRSCKDFYAQVRESRACSDANRMIDVRNMWLDVPNRSFE